MSANARILAENRVADNRGFAEFVSWYTELSSKTETLVSKKQL